MLMVVHLNMLNINNWRPYERENLVKYFGEPYEIDVNSNLEAAISALKPNIIRWHLSAEKTPYAAYRECCQIATKFNTIRHINSPLGWLPIHAKDRAFDIWLQSNIPVPQFVSFRTVEELKRIEGFPFPALVRINYGNTGEASYFVNTKDEAIAAANQIIEIDCPKLRQKYGEGVSPRLLLVKFIENLYKGYRYSYRIIVSGNRVITGYARMCSPPDWVAITSKFQPVMGGIFVELNQKCERFCTTHEPLIVKSVKSLGLDMQGVDVIFDEQDNPYFLEVQIDFSCGNPSSGDKPPWFNPSYPELVKFLKNKENELKVLMPMYYNKWLDKNALFNECYASLRGQSNEYR